MRTAFILAAALCIAASTQSFAAGSGKEPMATANSAHSKAAVSEKSVKDDDRKAKKAAKKAEKAAEKAEKAAEKAAKKAEKAAKKAAH